MQNKVSVYHFTQFKQHLQIKMNFNTDVYIEDKGKVRLIQNIIEEMNLNFLTDLYSKNGRKPAVDPIIMLQIILLCYSQGIYSCRKIEEACKYDIRCIYLLNGAKPPSYSAINDFRLKLVNREDKILETMVKMLENLGFIDLESIYIYGTKIESSANRYSFVWRKNIERYQESIRQKLIEDLNLADDISLENAKKILEIQFKMVKEKCKAISFVYGQGRRKTSAQREYEKLQHYLLKLYEYEGHLTVMGDRNSYSKTDIDATFMRMKDDHMKNGQLKPAYNLQIATASDFIVGLGIYPNPNDIHTLKPTVESLKQSYGLTIKNIVADSGYESIENYKFLEESKLKAYIKPANHEQKKKKKYKEEIGRKENMTYLKDQDAYQCKAGKRLTRQKDIYRTRPSGYKDPLRVYSCTECKDCPYNKECIKYSKKLNPDKKTIMYSPEFEELRKKSEKRISSDKGKEERLNRSIQAEGAFSKLKDGLNYTRYRHKGKEKAHLEMTLMSLAINMNTLYSKIINNRLEKTKHLLAS